jgi:hypothetical protein
VKDDHGDLVDSNNILNRRKNYFSQLLNVNSVIDVRQIEVFFYIVYLQSTQDT